MKRTAHIFILIDALGWEWVRSGDFLKSFAPHRYPLESVLGYSTAAIPSILTGLYPEQHGRLSLFQRALEESPFACIRWLCAMPEFISENRYVRYAAKTIACRRNHFGGWFHLLGTPMRHLPLLDVSERDDIYKPKGIPGAQSIFDLLSARGTKYRAYSYHDGTRETLLQAIGSDLARHEDCFYFLYLDTLDGFLHSHANDVAAVGLFLDSLDSSIASILEVAQHAYDDVVLNVFGDHGMAPTSHFVDVWARLDKLSVRSPKDYLCVLDSTMARFWLFSGAAREEIARLFNDKDGGHWLSEGELRSLHAWFPDHRYGEWIYLMPEGSIIASPDRGEIVSNGMHGFHPSATHSSSALLSSVQYLDPPRHITDVFSLMSEHA